jgi:hypothetical protein
MSKLKARLCLAYSEIEKARVIVSFSVRKKIIFANNMESRSFPSSFDIARRYAKHRVLEVLYAMGNGAEHRV